MGGGGGRSTKRELGGGVERAKFDPYTNKPKIRGAEVQTC